MTTLSTPITASNKSASRTVYLSRAINLNSSSYLMSLLTMLSLVSLLLALLSAMGNDAMAFGSKRSETNAPKPQQPQGTQAYPTRRVSFGNFYRSHFTLPDGQTNVDFSVLLPEIVLTAMTQTTNKLRPGMINHNTDPGASVAEPEDRFILRGGITAFEAEITTFNIKIGYRPGVGSLSQGKLVGGEGEVDLRIDQLDMDFYIFDTLRKEVVAVGKSDALRARVKGSIKINFDRLEGAADFMYKSAMADIFRKVSSDAIAQMVGDANTNFYMDWMSKVTRVDFATKSISFAAGQRDDVVVGNVFTIYDNSNTRVGEARVIETDFETSKAVFTSDSQGSLLNSVREDDTVKIYFYNLPRR